MKLPARLRYGSVVLLITAALLPIGASAQLGYIHLQGDQFIDEHGDPFYPMVMNYYVDYFYQGTEGMFPADPTALEVGTLRFGRSSLWSCVGWYNYPPVQSQQAFLQDMSEMKAQGFNTVRFVSNATKKEGVAGFNLSAKYHPSGQGGIAMNMDPPYDPDLNTNPVVWFHFNTILAVCSLANTLGMKVIVEPVLGPELVRCFPNDAVNLDHIAFLEALAQFLAAHQVHNLLAYEFYGEPTFADQGMGSQHTKAQICELAHSWSNAVRINDPDHLVTVGSVYHTDVMYEGWDPMLLDVDFATIHVYPLMDEWEWQQDPATFRAAATERYNCMFRFYDAHLRKPYIVTETGFAGEDPFVQCSTTPNPLIGYPMTCWGDETHQNDFLEATFAGIRDSRCAGYGWWIYMNMHWLPEPDVNNVNTKPLNTWKERYFGILKFGDPVSNPAPGTTGWEASRKQAAQTLADWATNPPAYAPLGPVPTTLDMNDRYFNQYMHPPNNITYDNPNVPGSPNQYGTLNGRVVDAATGEPIAGAVVHANNSTRHTVNPDFTINAFIRAYVTYTDDDGWFSLRALDDIPGSGLNNGNPDDLTQTYDWTVQDIKIAGHATEQVQANWHFQQNATYEANTLQPRIDRVLENVQIPQGSADHFNALASLTAFDMLIEGTSDLKARYEVHLTAEFHAAQGSETHIYTEPVFFTCDEVYDADIKSASSSGADISVQARASQRQMQLQFTVPNEEFALEVHPNPTTSIVACAVRTANADVVTLTYRLVDTGGNEVMQGSSSSSRFQINLSELATGAYVLHVSMGEQTVVRNLIKQ